jgi:hypothetical protein
VTRRTQIKRRIVSREPINANETIGDRLSKYFLPFAALIASAIFYYTGWVYISHWYGYYGIDATQVNVSVQNILVNGIPGVMVLFSTLIVAAFLVIVWKQITLGQAITLEELPHILIGGYVVAVLISIFVVTFGKFHIPVTWEAAMSWLALLLILIAINTLAESKRESAEFIPLLEFNQGGAITNGLRLRIAIDGILNRSIGLFKTAFANNKSEEFVEQSKRIRQLRIAQLRRQTGIIKNVIGQSKPFWLTTLLLLYFLVAISTSSILGEWDAVRGVHSMTGDWHIPKVSVYSNQKIPALVAFEKKDQDVFEYSPLGLLSSDDKVYYLVDWKTTGYYQHKPQVYIVPRLDNLTLNFLMSPYANPNVLPLPTRTTTPSAISTISISATP